MKYYIELDFSHVCVCLLQQNTDSCAVEGENLSVLLHFSVSYNMNHLCMSVCVCVCV